MHELQSNGQFRIDKLSLTVATFDPTSLPEDVASPKEFTEEIVKIDGVERKVYGVEHYCIVCPTERSPRCHHPFGLAWKDTSPQLRP